MPDFSLLFSSPFWQRLLLIFCGLALIAILVVSLVFYLSSETWERRVLFFQEVNTGRYVAEVRYLPPQIERVDDIRLLLNDILLGPANFGNSAILPQTTELNSAMLNENILYVSFSIQAYKEEPDVFQSRASLQAVANSVCFNFPWIKKIYFFINGKPVSDMNVKNYNKNLLEMANKLIPLLTDLKATVNFLTTYPVLKTFPLTEDLFKLEDGASWEEKLFKLEYK